MGLYDEAQQASGDKVATTVRDLGGGLYDELAIKQRNPGALTDAMKNQAVTDSRREMVQTLNDDLNVFEKFAVGAGRGLATLGRAVGAVEPEAPAVTGAFQALTEGARIPTAIPLPGGGMVMGPGSSAASFGELVGEATPFLPFGIAASGIKTMGLRILANIGIGAAEGGAIVKGRGGDAGQTAVGAVLGGTLAGTAEAIVPYIISMGRALMQRIGRKPQGQLLTIEGGPTPEFQAALDETGTSFEALAEDAYTKVNQVDVNPEQAARAARFESQRIPATQGDITQDFATQAREARLSSSANAGDGAETLRQTRLQQSDAFQDSVNGLVDSLGVPDATGDALKAALRSRENVLKSQKTKLYKQVAEANPEVANLPVFTSSIEEAYEGIGKAKLRRIRRLTGSKIDDVEDLMVEFGVIKDPEAVKAFVESGGEITPLSLGNFEDFRQGLNLIERADPNLSKTIANVTGPIRESLDAESKLIDDAVVNSGLADEGILATLKKARGIVRTLKTEFDPQEITGKLISKKRNGYTEIVEASRVSNELLRTGAPVEYLERTMASLRKAGTKGEQAIGHLRATTVLNGLEAALKAEGKKVNGQQLVSSGMFSKYLKDTVGEDKLKVLFQGAEDDLATLMNLKQTALDMNATNAARPLGSAPVNADIARALTGSNFMMATLGKIGVLLKAVVRPAVEMGQARKAITFTPEMKRVAGEFANQFPTLASVLGIAAVAPDKQKDMRP